MKKLASLLLLVLASGSALAQGARASDVASVDSIMAALYDSISGPAGKARDWDRLRSLFRNDGRMVVHSTGKDGALNTRVLSLEDYITRVTPVFAKEGFYESELARKGEEYGQIAQVFSTYEARHALADKPFVRGINSVQLVNDGKRWWISQLLWQPEGEKTPLPERYLKPQ